eukprot:UN30061
MLNANGFFYVVSSRVRLICVDSLYLSFVHMISLVHTIYDGVVGIYLDFDLGMNVFCTHHYENHEFHSSSLLSLSPSANSFYDEKTTTFSNSTIWTNPRFCFFQRFFLRCFILFFFIFFHI